MRRNATAITSTPMIMKLILRPVAAVIDCSAGTSAVRTTPSGVSSKAHAKISASGSPRMRNAASSVDVQSGRRSAGNMTSPTCISSQPTTR